MATPPARPYLRPLATALLLTAATAAATIVAALLLAALAPGLDPMQQRFIAVVGYLATGVYALFGLAHLSNIAFGANPAVTAAQAA